MTNGPNVLSSYLLLQLGTKLNNKIDLKVNHQKKIDDGVVEWVPVARFCIIFSINHLKNKHGLIQ